MTAGKYFTRNAKLNMTKPLDKFLASSHHKCDKLLFDRFHILGPAKEIFNFILISVSKLKVASKGEMKGKITRPSPSAVCWSAIKIGRLKCSVLYLFRYLYK
jgi:hypothetical protein